MKCEVTIFVRSMACIGGLNQFKAVARLTQFKAVANLTLFLKIYWIRK